MLLKSEIDIVVDNLDDMNELTRHTLCKEKIFLCAPKNYKINEGLEKYQIKPESIRNSTVNLDSVEPVSIEIFRHEKFIFLKDKNDMYLHASKIFKKEA